MTDIEFIENEMECCEIDFVLAQKREDKIMTRHLKERYEQLKQIKAKLEAWEVVKNKGVDMLIFMLYYDNLEEYNNYIKSLEGECNYEKCLLTQNEADTIKKALEAKNECRN